jgi:choline dehydrogenase-like flavoprotein
MCDNEFAKLSPAPNMGRSAESILRAANNVAVVLNANVTEIEADQEARMVVGVRAATLAGNAFRVRASYFVLAAGGLENARLLLVSNRVMAKGLGNEFDWVGRCFMEHPRFFWGTLRGADLASRLDSYNPGSVVWQREQRRLGRSEAALVGTGLVLNPATQRSQMILNARSWIVPMPECGETESGWELRELLRWLIKRRIPSDWLSRLRVVARDVRGAIRTIPAYYRGRSGRARQWQFVTVMEQEPNTSSRVTLDASRDRLGVARVRLDWRLGSLERKTLDENRRIIVASLSRLGLDCSSDNSRSKRMREKFDEAPRWVWHHMGTTRMSANCKQGVVDADCRVHGIPNLYVAGSSVFPTGGNDMPTLTIVALGHRLADHLKAQLKRSAPRERGRASVAREPAPADETIM